MAQVPLPSKISLPYSANGNAGASSVVATSIAAFSSEAGLPNLSSFLFFFQLTKAIIVSNASDLRIVFILPFIKICPKVISKVCRKYDFYQITKIQYKCYLAPLFVPIYLK